MKRIFALMFCLIIACLALTGCGNQDNAENDAGKNGTTSAGQAAQLPDGVQVKKVDGMYEWNIRGVTLRTKSNVADYIHGKAWDFKAFLKTLGWVDRYEEEMKTKDGLHATIYTYNDPKKPYIGFGNSTISFTCEKVTIPTEEDPYHPEYIFYGFHYRIGGNDDMYYLNMMEKYYERKPCDYYFDNEPDSITIPFEIIVYFTYACEHLVNDSNVDPLDGVAPKDPDSNCNYNI